MLGFFCVTIIYILKNEEKAKFVGFFGLNSPSHSVILKYVLFNLKLFFDVCKYRKIHNNRLISVAVSRGNQHGKNINCR